MHFITCILLANKELANYVCSPKAIAQGCFEFHRRPGTSHLHCVWTGPAQDGTGWFDSPCSVAKALLLWTVGAAESMGRGRSSGTSVCNLPEGVRYASGSCMACPMFYKICTPRVDAGTVDVNNYKLHPMHVPVCFRFNPDQVMSPRKPQHILKGTAFLGKGVN